MAVVPRTAALPGPPLIPNLSLLDLPDELLLRICSFLRGNDVHKVACTNRRLRYLTTDDPLWRQLCVNDVRKLSVFGSNAPRQFLAMRTPVHGLKGRRGWPNIRGGPPVGCTLLQYKLSFGLEGRSWRAVHRLPRNSDVCSHLWVLGTAVLVQKRLVLASPPPGHERCRQCKADASDRWLCLTPECRHVGCGRRQPNKHAMRHWEATAHPLAVRINTLEVWCYVCRKWIGGSEEPELERERLLEIVRSLANQPPDLDLMAARQQDRTAWTGLSRQDRFFLVAMEWFNHWIGFIMGDVEPPPARLVASQAALHAFIEADGAVMFNIDYYVFNEAMWRYVQQRYSIEPEIAEDDVDNQIVLHVLHLLRQSLVS